MHFRWAADKVIGPPDVSLGKCCDNAWTQKNSTVRKTEFLHVRYSVSIELKLLVTSTIDI